MALNWRLMGITAGILGVLAGVVPMFFGADLLYSTMPIAMMFAIYITIPRVKDNRFVTGMIVSLLTAVITIAVYFIYQFATVETAQAVENLKSAVINLAMSIIFITLFGAFLFSKVHGWTEKKRAEIDAKVAAKQASRNQKTYGATKKKYKKKKKK